MNFRTRCLQVIVVLTALVVTGAFFLFLPSRSEAQWPPSEDHYYPDLRSIARHELPTWFQDAKLGIFPVWGIYSVPGWATPTGELGKVDPEKWFFENPYAEWYWNSMKLEESDTWKRHVELYGADFTYADFIPEFQEEAEKWDPAEWARLFKEFGGKYVIFTAKFADGYPLWPTDVEHPHLPVNHIADRRDYVGELTEAVRNEGLKMGLYYCGGMDWSFVEKPVRTFQDVFLTVPQSPEYANVADAHWRELINRYEPQVLWNDISYPEVAEFDEIVSDYYNRFPEGLINNRFGRLSQVADFTTPEYATYSEITTKKWESTRGVGFSFGYNQAETVDHLLSADELIDMFVDVVSKNGNLLIAVGPRADGSIPELQVARLRELGRWLEVNGEAIYGSRYWVRAEGSSPDGIRVRFTQKEDSLYVFLLDRPEAESLVLEELWLEPESEVRLLGRQEPLSWRQLSSNLEVQLPGELPSSHAHVLRVSPMPWGLMKKLELATGE